MRPWLALILILATPGLAGCIGFGGSDEPVERTQKARADVTESLGGIEGVVTDDAVQPVLGATMRIVETDQTTTTADDGSYAFSNLRPATYTLRVEADAFVPASDSVRVTANSVVNLDFVVTHLFTEEAYTQKLELAGFLECGHAIGYNLTVLPEPPSPVPDQRAYAISWRPCELANVFENTTNDRSNHYFEVDPPVETFVFESRWDASTGSFAERLWIDVVINGFHCPNYCNWTVLDMDGESPLQARIDRERFDSIQEYYIEACDQGDDDFCGYSFFDSGWDLWSRVYPRWECQDAPVQTCLPFQQSYTHFVSAFLNAPAPQGYSAVS